MAKNLMQSLNERLEGRKVRNEKGLALLDVLIGMAIFALVAIIAVSAISQYRARAYQNGALSDVKAVATWMEAASTDSLTGAYPDPTDPDNGFVADDGNLTSGNSIGDHQEGAGTFTVCVQHTSGAYAIFDSSKGTVTDKRKTGGCP